MHIYSITLKITTQIERKGGKWKERGGSEDKGKEKGNIGKRREYWSMIFFFLTNRWQAPPILGKSGTYIGSLGRQRRKECKEWKNKVKKKIEKIKWKIIEPNEKWKKGELRRKRKKKT